MFLIMSKRSRLYRYRRIIYTEPYNTIAKCALKFYLHVNKEWKNNIFIKCVWPRNLFFGKSPFFAVGTD